MDSTVTHETRLVYCTTGVLLRRLQSEPELTDVTHVVRSHWTFVEVT
jgi:HrpA-like RNA helicase